MSIGNEIKIYDNKEIVAVKFNKKLNEVKACDLCCFKLGECRGAILKLGQCYIPGILDIYYRELDQKDNGEIRKIKIK